MVVHLVNKCYRLRNKSGGFTRLLLNRRYSSGASNLTLTKPENEISYRYNIGKESLLYRNIGQALTLAAEEYGDRECIVSIHEGERYTFREIDEKVTQIASGLISSGFEKGDRLAICFPNSIHWYLTAFAAARAGLVSVAINPAYQVSEIKYCINKVGVKGIVAPETFKTQQFYKMLEKLAPNLSKSSPGNLDSSKIPTLKTVIIASDNNLPGAYNFNDIPSLATSESDKNLSVIEKAVQPDEGCNIQFTSGTTGQPKAALLSHYNFINNSYHIGTRNELRGNKHRICIQNPFFHVFGLVITILPALQHGATLVVPGASYKPAETLVAIEKEKCTTVHGTPTMYVDLIAKQKEINASLDSLEIAVTGGAPCSPQLFNQIKDVLQVKRVKTVYGLTEASASIFQSLPGESPELTTSTVGFIQDHTEIKLIDEQGKIVPIGTPGELCVRYYANMLHYWDDPEKTRETIGLDRWLKTGDKFILEPNGYGRIVGRIKDMIIRGGENIFPKEIEDFINTHPDVLESHVIGISDERMGEEICAVVRLREGKTLTQAELKAFSKGKIAHFKIPKYVQITDSFPKTQTGKVQKFKLREQIEKSGVLNK